MNPEDKSEDDLSDSGNDSQMTGNSSGPGNVNLSMPINNGKDENEDAEEKPFKEKAKEQLQKGAEQTKEQVEEKWRNSKAFREQALADIKEAFNKNNPDWDIGRICIIIVVASLVTVAAILVLKIVYFIWSIIYWIFSMIYWIFIGWWKD